jgi:SHS family lactate transporter-like MFS transporter
MTGVGAILGGALGVGYSGVTPALVTSMFDERVRARAIGLVYHAGALIAAFVPLLIPLLEAHTQLTLAGAIATVVGVGLVALASSVILLRRSIEAAPAVAASAPVIVTLEPVRALVPLTVPDADQWPRLGRI